ncbi:MAG TPA: hypothetical protein VJ777_17525 [Mycobacterium sp.]|nr:hypothetical protein [Mycobacterium sp.]
MKREDAQVSNPNPQAGQTVKVTGGNTEPFAPNQDLSIELRSDSVALGITRSLGDGTYAAEVIIPSDTAAGTHTIVVAGLHRDGGRLESSVEIELSGTATADSQSGSASRSAAGAQQGGALMAATGWSPGLLMLAAVLALTGASLVRVGRRRDSLDFLGSRRDHGQFRRQ